MYNMLKIFVGKKKKVYILKIKKNWVESMGLRYSGGFFSEVKHKNIIYIYI